MALVTPSPLPQGVTTAASMDSSPSTLLCQLMSNASTWMANTPSALTGQFQSTNHTTYWITQQTSTDTYNGTRVDSGANGGMAGSDTHVLATAPHTHVNITGVGGSVLECLPLVQCASLVKTFDEGPNLHTNLMPRPFIPNPKWSTLVVWSMIPP